MKTVAIALVVLIGLSRVYLGVHFPTDVIAGWLIGIVLLILYQRLLPGVLRVGGTLPAAAQIMVIAGLPAVIAALYPSKDAIGAMGALAGAGIGLFIAAHSIGIAISGTLSQRILRVMVGAPVALLLYLGLKALFPPEVSAWYLPLRFVRYWTVGLWMGLSAPWLYSHLRLAATGTVR